MRLLLLLFLALPSWATNDPLPSGVERATDFNFRQIQEEYSTFLSSFNAANFVPTGAIIYIGTSTVPTGWLEGNGDAVSRTTYAALYSAYGVTFGQGDGSTTFNLPDCRGRFVRGWDHSAGRDPDSATRTASATGGSSGDYVGSVQTSTITAHVHTVATTVGLDTGTGAGAVVHTTGATVNSGTTPPSGGAETRPINIALMCIIKY